MDGSIHMRNAVVEEAPRLSDLAIRSKGHWGYPAEFLETCRSELSVPAERLLDADFECVLATDGRTILGFYSLDIISATQFELEALFVEPQHLGCGVGRMLMEHAMDLAQRKGGETIVIHGDPHATDFYLKMGARRIGERESGSVPGRFLPLFEITVRRGADALG